MKIAHIAPPWITIPPKNYGGTENVIYNLVEEQVAQGHDVTLFAPGDARTSAHLIPSFPQSLICTGVPWHAHLKAFYHFYKAVEYIKRHQFDIVHMHLSSSADMYLFPLTVSIMTPRVMTLHSRFPFDRAQSWVGDADRFFLEWMMSMPMVAISQSARAEVEYPLNFVDVIHHGVPMHHFKPSVSHPEDYLAWLGRFTPEKGARFAIEVARAMNIPLVLAGTVDRHMPESVRYFEEVIKPQVDGTLIKYIGPVDLPAKVNLLSRARGLLNPIIWEEPFGMVMIEAMAVGCPVVSFARGAAPEIVVHKKSGYLVHDVQEMIACVRCLEQIDRRIVFNHAEQNFSARIMAEKYVRLYRRICATARVQSRSITSALADHLPVSPCLLPVPSASTTTAALADEQTLPFSGPLGSTGPIKSDSGILQ
jgi:glycosyltransferase involved in cell wall biosynthesis